MIKNIERLEIPNVDLYKVFFANEVPVQRNFPGLTFKFENEADLIDFFIKYIAFIPDEEKVKLTLDINNIEDEEAFKARLLEIYEGNIKKKE
jgi:hypothetical protein